MLIVSRARWLTLGLSCAAGLSILAAPALALDPQSTDARAILRAALEGPGVERSESRMKMVIRDGSGTRERLMNLRAKRYESARKSLILVEQPADVRNTGFLTIDYRATDKPDEQWLYLPKLHRVSRVPSSGKSDSFVGSDFSVADMTPQSPDNYEVKLLERSVKVGDEECWLLETKPRSEELAEETGYQRTQLWVSKQKLVSVQLKLWLTGSSRIKYFKATDIRQVNGVWTSHRLQMRTLEGSNVVSETQIDVLKADNDAKNISDSDFTQQRLEQGV